MQKDKIRSEFKKRILSFQESSNSADERICAKLYSLDIVSSSNSILCFYPLATEPDIKPFIQGIIADKQVFLPLVDSEAVGEISDLESLVTGNFGIKEPVAKTLFSSFDVILIPAIAYDLNGTRLGHGVGWYDRFLLKVSSKAVRIGICYHCQISSALLPKATHDQVVDIILTEEIIHKTHARKYQTL